MYEPVDVAGQVLLADLVQESRALEGDDRLRMDVGEDHQRPLLAAAADEVAQGVQAGRVDRRHVAHPQDQDLGLPGDPAHPVLEHLGGAEEERAADLVDLHAVGDRPTAHGIGVGLEVVFGIRELVCEHVDVRDLGHAAHEEERGQHHPDLDRYREIHEHGEQYRHVALRGPELGSEGAPLAHVERDDDEDGRERGERHQPHPAAEEQRDEEQRHGMRHPRHGRAAAVLDVRRGPGDGARRRHAAEDRRHDVGDPLGHELHVGAVAAADHAVRHDRRQQRLDGA